MFQVHRLAGGARHWLGGGGRVQAGWGPGRARARALVNVLNTHILHAFKMLETLLRRFKSNQTPTATTQHRTQKSRTCIFNSRFS